MAKDEILPKRRNRAVTVADAANAALDPALRKRGFASRDIITHWSVMAPKPYGEVAIPDKLTWPRGERSAEGATLYLRCVAGHALAISHEGQAIAAAINRYFGYVLIGAVRLSAEPFIPGSGKKTDTSIEPSPTVKAKVGAQVEQIENPGLREALRLLGHAMASRSERNTG